MFEVAFGGSSFVFHLAKNSHKSFWDTALRSNLQIPKREQIRRVCVFFLTHNNMRLSDSLPAIYARYWILTVLHFLNAFALQTFGKSLNSYVLYTLLNRTPTVKGSNAG